MFDLFFMLDRFLSLFVGYYNKEDTYEPKVMVVIMKNFSSDFYLELVYTFGPFFYDLDKLNTILYFIFKIPRYSRLFSLEVTMNKYIEYYGSNWNEFEIKKTVK